jgi:hypothetical protein
MVNRRITGNTMTHGGSFGVGPVPIGLSVSDLGLFEV